MSRIKTEVQAQGTVSYDYDAAGRQTKITWPDSFYVNYDYDVSGAVTKVRENGATSGVGVLATYQYDDLGRRTKLTYGNGNVTDYAYDGASRLTDLDHDLGGTTHDTDIDFSYNPAGQITQRVGSNDIYAWLDHWNIDATAIVNGLNQATSVDGDTVGYDSKGNVTSYDGVTYTYDAENFLTAANGYTISYDAAGRFHQRTKSGVDPRKALYAGDRMIALYKGDDTVNNYFIHGASVDEPIVRRNPGGVRRFLVKDERGSVIASTKDDGSVATDNTYDAYGRNGDTNAGRFQYTGQQWWGDFGLYYYKARWYNPELGRFMQTDPIGYGDGMNMYGYVGGDPVNKVDPWGLEGCDPGDDCPEDQIVVEGSRISLGGINQGRSYGGRFGLGGGGSFNLAGHDTIIVIGKRKKPPKQTLPTFNFAAINGLISQFRSAVKKFACDALAGEAQQAVANNLVQNLTETGLFTADGLSDATIVINYLDATVGLGGGGTVTYGAYFSTDGSSRGLVVTAGGGAVIDASIGSSVQVVFGDVAGNTAGFSAGLGFTDYSINLAEGFSGTTFGASGPLPAGVSVTAENTQTTSCP